MKKKISYAILFSLFLVSCFAYDEIQWKTTKDLYNVPVLSSGGHWSQEDIRQDTLLKTSNKSGVFYNGYDAGFRDDFYVSAEFENAEVCLPLDSVVNVTCKMQLPEALISGKTKPKYVDEITLQSFFSNRKQLIKQTYPNGVTNAEDEYFPWETLLEINGGDLYLSNVYVKLSNSFNFGLSKFFIKDMEMIDEKTYKFECICEDFYHPDSKYKIEKEAIAMLYAEIDGDYINVFLFDTENLFKIYARINKETEHELNSYFETGLCNLSKVTWPRHADGTCDYDNANDNETASTSGNPDTSAEAAVSKPAPAVGKTATVTENLRLRTDDKATAEVVTTLAAGTRVKVEAIGKEETIDGITSNWVQVSVFDGAQDKDGNAIEAGTTVKQRLENEASEIDLWNGGLEKIFLNSPYFYHPIYFINHLDKAGLFEFNPYEGKTLKKVTNRAYSTWFNFDGTNYDLTKTIVSNPGFAPYDPDLFSKYEINGYACINTLFLEKMEYGTKKYSHEEIDFAGKKVVSSKTDKKLRTPIHSFITGIVVKTGNHKTLNYGKHLIISDGNNRLFLLGHLYDYADGIKVGSRIFPGDTVGYVGNSGNCAGLSEEEKKDGSGTHLHLTVYMTETAKSISNQPMGIMVKEINDLLYSDGTYKTYSCEKYKNINPFNYEEKR